MERTGNIWTILIFAILIMNGLPLEGDLGIGGSEGALTGISPITIDGDSQLAGHPALRGGSGSSADPYLFSDYMIDTSSLSRSAIYITNTTKAFMFRNVTIIGNSASTAIKIFGKYQGGYIPLYGYFVNVTVIGPGRHAYLYLPNYLSFSDCRFVKDTQTADLIYCYYGYEFSFVNNTFQAPDSRFMLDRSYQYKIRRNTGSLGSLESSLFRYSDIANNTLEIDSIKVYSGYLSDIQGNRLTSDSSSADLVTVIDCNRIKIANNTISGGRYGTHISHPNAYTPVYTNYPRTATIMIEYNTFNSSYTGLYLYWTTGHPAMTYFTIHHNDFINCTSFGLEIPSTGGSKTSRVFLNRFINNSGDSPQAKDYWYMFQWRNESIGNHWSDWTYPDENSDGFVDSDYMIAGINNAKDTRPVSNPYFDFERPEFTLLSPRGQFLNGSYINFTWIASDRLSGIDKVQIREGLGNWIDVRGRSHQGYHVQQGQYPFYLRAVDKGNLTRQIEVSLKLNNTRDPMRIASPIDGSFHPSSSVEFDVRYDSHFVPRTLTARIDGGPPVQRAPYESFTLTLDEGPHSVDLEATDFYGITIGKDVSYTVDLTPPALRIRYPTPGSVISNRLVNFGWDASDVNGIQRTRVRIDTLPWTDTDNDFHSSLLSDGKHTFTVEVTDRTGLTTTSDIDFTVARNTSLSIINPILSRPTRSLYHVVEWEYLSAFSIDRLTISINSGAPVLIPNITRSYEVSIFDEGKNLIRVEARDQAGNTISDEVEIYLDRTPPKPDFKGFEDPSYLDRDIVIFQWGAVESVGMDHYELYVDGERRGGDLLMSEYAITLSEGAHSVELLAIDLAGNIGRKNLTLIIDTTDPILEIVSFPEDVLDHTPFLLRWKGTDAFGISQFNLTVSHKEGSRTIELGTDEEREVQFKEGVNTLIMRCSDNAGNTVEVTRTTTVDLYKPKVDIGNKGPLGEGIVTGSRVINITWTATDSVGITDLRLLIDGFANHLPLDTTFYPVSLEEGDHTVELIAFDISGRSDRDTLGIVVDLTSPLVVSLGDPEVTGDDAIVRWAVSPNETATSWSLEMDGVEQTGLDPTLGYYRFTDLSEGIHTVNITITDRAGNTNMLTWTVEIEPETGGGDDGGDWGSMLIMIVLLVAVGIVTAIAALIFIARKRPKEERKITRPERPRKLDLRPIPQAPRVAVSQEPVHHSIEAGPSYIRPNRGPKAPPKRSRSIPTPEIERRGPRSTPEIPRPAPRPAPRPQPAKVSRKAEEEDIPVWDEDSEVEWDELPEWDDA